MSNVSSGQTIIINQAKSNGLGTAGFVIALLGFFTCGLISPLGLLFSLIGLFKAPRGLAIAGTVLGLIGSWWMIFFGLAIVGGFLGIAGDAAAGSKAMVEANRIKAARVQLFAFESALDIYQLDIGTYPTSRQGLQALLVAPADLPDPAKWQRPYLKESIPLDPWEHEYQYESTAPNTCRVWSMGPDGISGTEDDIATVTSDGSIVSSKPKKSRPEVDKKPPSDDTPTADTPTADEKPAEATTGQPVAENEPAATAQPEWPPQQPQEQEKPSTDAQPPTGSHSDYRTWTDASGRFSVEARYVKNVMGTITLEKRDGTTVDLTLEKLSDVDREFIKNRKAAK